MRVAVQDRRADGPLNARLNSQDCSRYRPWQCGDEDESVSTELRLVTNVYSNAVDDFDIEHDGTIVAAVVVVQDVTARRLSRALDWYEIALSNAEAVSLDVRVGAARAGAGHPRRLRAAHWARRLRRSRRERERQRRIKKAAVPC